jgi:hypothetical protein
MFPSDRWTAAQHRIVNNWTIQVLSGIIFQLKNSFSMILEGICPILSARLPRTYKNKSTILNPSWKSFKPRPRLRWQKGRERFASVVPFCNSQPRPHARSFRQDYEAHSHPVILPASFQLSPFASMVVPLTVEEQYQQSVAICRVGLSPRMLQEHE